MDGQTARQPGPCFCDDPECPRNHQRTPEELQEMVSKYSIVRPPPPGAVKKELSAFMLWCYRENFVMGDEQDFVPLSEVERMIDNYLESPYFTQRGDRNGR
jgi:hypothetical protein